jgi:hypothetical protein
MLAAMLLLPKFAAACPPPFASASVHYLVFVPPHGHSHERTATRTYPALLAVPPT